MIQEDVMNEEILKAAYELGVTAGKMEGYLKAMRDIQQAREEAKNA